MRMRLFLPIFPLLAGCLSPPPGGTSSTDAGHDAVHDAPSRSIDADDFDRNDVAEDAAVQDVEHSQDVAFDLNNRECELESIDLEVEPTWSFLRRDPTETRAKPGHVLALDDAALEPGDQVRFGSFGTIRHNSGDRFTHLNAVFSSTNIVLGPLEAHRVPGAIGADLEFLSPPTTAGLDTDIPEDFEILPTGTVVTVPDGAAFLVIGLPDENSSNNYVEDAEGGKPLTLTIGCPERR